MNVKVLDTMFPSIEIHIRSDDYKFKMGENDFLFEIHETIKNPNHNLYYMTAELSGGEFPVSFYNVNQNNNRFDFSYEGSSHSCILSVGNYNMNQLLSHFSSKLTSYAFSNPINIAWNASNNRLTFTSSKIGALSLKETSTCLAIIGFTKKQHDTRSNSDTTLQSDAMCDIRKYSSFFLHTDLFSNGYSANTQKDNNSHNILARIPVNAGVYGTVVYKPTTPHNVPIPKSTIKVFRFSIRDFEGKIIDMNSMMWNATITKRFHKINSAARDYKSTNAFGVPNSNSSILSAFNTAHQLRSHIDSILNEYKNGNLDYSRLLVR
jgi:hypothetical protein